MACWESAALEDVSEVLDGVGNCGLILQDADVAFGVDLVIGTVPRAYEFPLGMKWGKEIVFTRNHADVFTCYGGLFGWKIQLLKWKFSRADGAFHGVRKGKVSEGGLQPCHWG